MRDMSAKVTLSLLVGFALAGCGDDDHPITPDGPPTPDAGADGAGNPDAPPGAAGTLDVTRYTLAITLDPAQGSYAAQAILDVNVTAAGASFALDLAADVVVDQVGGLAAGHARQGDVLTLTAAGTVPIGPAQATVMYHGDMNQLARFTPDTCPTAFGGLMITTNSHGDTIIDSYNWPFLARRWIPSHDHPSDGAALDLSVTIDAAYTVVANGTLAGTVDNAGGTRTWHWIESHDMPVYDVHIAAFPYVEHDLGTAAGGIPVKVYLYPEDAAFAAPVGEAVGAIGWLGAQLAPYAWEKYFLVEAPICGGAMEEATVVTMDETTLADPTYSRNTTVHELVHHWIGNAVRIASWNDFWISEGFAENLTGLYLLATYGAAVHDQYMSDAWQNAHDWEAPAYDHPVRPPDPEVNVYDIFDGLSYDKANWLLHSLREHIGDAAFWQGVRGFYAAHAFAAAGTDELQAAFEAASAQDLDWFFDQFVRTAFHPQLAGSFSFDAGTGTATVTIDQVQQRGLARYQIPVDVELLGAAAGQSVRQTVTLTADPQVIAVTPGFTPTRLVLDPDEKLYIDVKCLAPGDCPAGRTCGGGFCRR